MSEQIYYDQKGIRVTLNLLMIQDEVYAVARFTTVELHTEQPDRRDPLVWILIGLLGLIFVIGIIFIAIGVYRWLIQQPTYYLKGWVGTQTIILYRSVNLESVRSLSKALQQAIAHNRLLVMFLNAAQAQQGVLTDPEMCALSHLNATELKPILDLLLHQRLVTLREGSGPASAYDFTPSLTKISTALQALRARNRAFLTQEIQQVTGLSMADAQSALEHLVSLGEATPARDVKYGGIHYRLAT